MLRCSMVQTTVQHATDHGAAWYSTDHGAAWYRPQCSMVQTTVQHATDHSAAWYKARCSMPQTVQSRKSVGPKIRCFRNLVSRLQISCCAQYESLLVWPEPASRVASAAIHRVTVISGGVGISAKWRCWSWCTGTDEKSTSPFSAW